MLLILQIVFIYLVYKTTHKGLIPLLRRGIGHM